MARTRAVIVHDAGNLRYIQARRKKAYYADGICRYMRKHGSIALLRAADRPGLHHHRSLLTPITDLCRPSLPRRQVPLLRASASDEFTPPLRRAAPGPHAGCSPARGRPITRAFITRLPPRPGFDTITNPLTVLLRARGPTDITFNQAYSPQWSEIIHRSKPMTSSTASCTPRGTAFAMLSLPTNGS